MEQAKIKCPAKINLAIDVISKRDDGYHNVDMIMQSIPLYDNIDVIKTASGKINIKTNNPTLCTNENNIAYKSAKLFFEKAKIDSGLDICIEKNILVGAGLAGGSADAAGVLIALNRIYETDYTQKELMEMGVAIGADVPFCVMSAMEKNGGVTARATGAGEQIKRINSNLNVRYVIANPGFEVSTAWVYQNLKLDQMQNKPDIINVIDGVVHGDIRKIAENTANVLESVTVKKYPVLADYKNILLNCGAAFSLMSGSGPTVFGVFETNEDAQKAYDKIKEIADFAIVL